MQNLIKTLDLHKISKKVEVSCWISWIAKICRMFRFLPRSMHWLAHSFKDWPIPRLHKQSAVVKYPPSPKIHSDNISNVSSSQKFNSILFSPVLFFLRRPWGKPNEINFIANKIAPGGLAKRLFFSPLPNRFETWTMIVQTEGKSFFFLLQREKELTTCARCENVSRGGVSKALTKVELVNCLPNDSNLYEISGERLLHIATFIRSKECRSITQRKRARIAGRSGNKRKNFTRKLPSWIDYDSLRLLYCRTHAIVVSSFGESTIQLKFTHRGMLETVTAATANYCRRFRALRSSRQTFP